MDCEGFIEYNNKIRQILNQIVSQDNTEESKDAAINLIKEIYEAKKIGDLGELCSECMSCIDFDILFNILYKYCSGHDKEFILQRLHEFDRATTIDEVRHNLVVPNFSEEDFNIICETKPGEKNNQIVYFDLNIMNQYMNDCEFRDLIKESKKNGFIYAYSPAHLEEFVNMGCSESRENRINIICDLTDQLEILPDGENLKLVYEHPTYPLNRIFKNPYFNKGLEQLKFFDYNDKYAYFPKYNEEDHKRKINNEDIFLKYKEEIQNILLFYGASFSVCELNNMFTDGMKRDISSIDEVFNALYYTFDMLSYWSDKEEKKIKNSIYDIEHLTYAWKCDILVSFDNRFFHRANAIYKFLGFNTTVLKKDDYVKKLIKREKYEF